MSDSNLDDDNLISQDDIDNLLDASSIEDAGARRDEPGDSDDDGTDDLGDLSQDDIDSLLNGSALDGDEADEAGELSQDDIDGLMNGNLAGPDDDGELSQDDIDSLMGGTEDNEDEDLELISQSDIDRLMNPSQDSSPEDGEGDDDEFISMDDIQGMINGEASKGGDPEPPGTEETTGETVNLDAAPEEKSAVEPSQKIGIQEGEDDQDPLDQAIDATEALDVSDCLMTQETLDGLIAGAGITDTDDPTDENGDLSQDPDLDQDIVRETMEDLTGDLSQDLDQMLESDDDDLMGRDPVSGDEGDVSQEDIDALLQDADDGDEFIDDDDILISQDDIDTLLMAADQEDEDVLGEDDIDGMDDIDHLDTEDFLDEADDQEEKSGIDQVVLEGADLAGETAESSEPPRRKPMGRMLKSKLVLASVAAVLVLGISVPVAYFLLVPRTPEWMPENEPVPLVAEDVLGGGDVATVTVGPEPKLFKQSGNIILADFIILVSDRSEKMTYVYADISIDYSDQRAYHEISANSSFYRDLIYESIQASLVSEKGNEVTEADLLWGVEASLKNVLPPQYIKKISFKSFRTS